MVSEVGVFDHGAVCAHGIGGGLTGAGVASFVELAVSAVECRHALHEVGTIGVVAQHVMDEADAVGTATGEVVIVKVLEGAAEEFLLLVDGLLDGLGHHCDGFFNRHVAELEGGFGLRFGLRGYNLDVLDEGVDLFLHGSLVNFGFGRNLILEHENVARTHGSLILLLGDEFHLVSVDRTVDHGFGGLGVEFVDNGVDFLLFEACSDKGDLEFIVEAVVDTCTPNDIGSAIGAIEDEVGDVTDFIHFDFVLRRVGEVQEDILGATDVGVVEEDRSRSGGDGLDGTVLALAGACAHESGTGVFHDGVNILEVDIDASATSDDFGDTFGGGEEDIVGKTEGFGDVEVAEGAEFVIIDNDDGVDMLAELLDTSFGLIATTLAFEGEGASDDGHNKYLLVFIVLEVNTLGYLGDDGRGAGASAATHTSGNKEHLGVVVQGILDVSGLIDGGLAGALGFVASTETKVTQRYLIGYGRGIEGFHVGIADNEVDAIDTLTVHMVNGIATTTTDTNDLNVRRLAFRGIESEERSLLNGLIFKINIILHVLVYFYLTE